MPVLEPAPGGPAARFASLFGRRVHPAVVFFVAMLGGLVLLTACSLAAGYLLVDVLARVPGVGSANRHVDSWLAHHRTPGRTEASLIGSIAAGWIVLPIVAGVVAAALAVARKWRVAAFALFAPFVEVVAYSGTTLLFHEHRPRVHRLEHLSVEASFPSGHTAASIAVYAGFVLLLTSRFRSPAFRAIAWSVAVAIPLYVALCRMYRGMHYPLDATGGALLGIGSLCVVVFAVRAAGAADHRPPPR